MRLLALALSLWRLSWSVFSRSRTSEVVLACLLLAALVATYLAPTEQGRLHAKLSAKNLLICGSLITLIVFPFLFLARGTIFNYYIIGHVLGVEKYIRAKEFGVSSLFDQLTYYPLNVLIEHFSKSSIALNLVVLGNAAVICLLKGRDGIRRALVQLKLLRFEFLALVLSITTPLVLLTLDTSKSPVVGGIVTVPCILMLVLLTSAFTKAGPILPRPLPLDVTKPTLYLRSSLPPVFVIVALGIFLGNGTARQSYLNRSDLLHVNRINEAIAGYIIDNSILRPRISFDRVTDYLNPATVQLFGYEGWRHFVDVVPELGWGSYGIFATPRDVAMKLLRESDIIVLTDPIIGREHSVYPMDSKIREYWGDMSQWTNDNFLPLYTTNIDGIPFHVFHKPSLKSVGGSGDWITRQGLVLILGRVDLQRWPFVILEGDIDSTLLGGEPRPRAISEMKGEPTIELPASIRVSNSHYRIVIDAHTLARASGEASIKLTFDRYFVPKQRGINEDTRELVIKLPTLQELRSKASD